MPDREDKSHTVEDPGISRRSLLHTLVAAAGVVVVGSALPSVGRAEGVSKPQRRIPWSNWSGSQRCFPQARKAPRSLVELQEMIAAAPGHIRPVGAGHSFMPLVPTEDTIVSLSRMSGVVSHDAASLQAVIRGGTRLGDIGAPLAKRGQALVNMPDIDEQTLAGALGTATHGTGVTLGCMSSFVEGLQLVTASGEVLECNRHNNADLFNAARVNLGALGVVTEVRMQNLGLYSLKRETTWMPIEDILDTAESVAESNRNFEFYYIPFSGMGFQDIHNLTTESPSSTELMDQNDGTETLRQVRDWLGWSPKVRELVLSSYLKTVNKEVTVAASWQTYAKERNVRFNEMEYHLPRDNALKAFREIKAVVEKNFPEVFFPFEVRFIKSDDIWLSPFYGRETCSIAVHRPACYIATPVLKSVGKTELPGAGLLPELMTLWNPNREQAFYTYGGYWKAKPESPQGLSTNPLWGHSTNQEMYNASASVHLKPDDWIFLRPTQSEFVFLQFGELVVHDNGRVTDFWPVLDQGSRS